MAAYEVDNKFNKVRVWCPQLPVLTPLIELLHKTKRHHSTADKHCVLDMPRTMSLVCCLEATLRCNSAGLGPPTTSADSPY